MIPFIRRWTWLSLAAPVIAFAVCFIVDWGVTDFLWPEDMFAYTRMCLAWRFSFLASAFVGLLALLGSLVIRDKWCFLRSLSGLVFTGLVAKFSVVMTMIC